MVTDNVFARVWRAIKAEEPPVSMFLGQTDAGTGAYDYTKYADEAYSQNPVVRAIMRSVGLAAASVRWYILEDVGDKQKEIPVKGLSDKLLVRPNEWQSWGQWIEAYMGYLILGGNGYLLSVGPKMGAPGELWWLEPQRITTHYSSDPARPVARYEYTAQNGRTTNYQPEELLHVKLWNPTEPPYRPGIPLLSSAASAIDAHNRGLKWNAALLKNSARPSGVMVVKGAMSKPTRDAARQELDEKFSGPSNAGRPPVMEGDAQWQQMSLSPVEMDWLGGMRDSARMICAVVGYPAQLLGDSELNTYSNMQEARKALYTECVLPMLDILAGDLNRWLMPKFTPGRRNVRLVYDDDSIDALAEDRGKVWERTQRSEFLTLNEQREALGYETIPDGDVLLVSTSKQSLDDLLAAPEPQPAALAAAAVPVEDEEEIE